MSRLSKQMKDTAVRAGLCREHTANWKPEWSVKDLMEYYIANPNWCMERRYPSLDTMRRNFKGDMARKKGIYIDEEAVFESVLQRYFFHNCKAGVIVKNITRIYSSLASSIKVIVKNGGRVVIDAYDATKLEVEVEKGGVARIYLRGDNVPSVTGEGLCMIRDKRKDSDSKALMTIEQFRKHIQK